MHGPCLYPGKKNNPIKQFVKVKNGLCELDNSIILMLNFLKLISVLCSSRSMFFVIGYVLKVKGYNDYNLLSKVQQNNYKEKKKNMPKCYQSVDIGEIYSGEHYTVHKKRFQI